MKPITIINAPSVYGHRPTGVENAPEALRSAGLIAKLHATDGGVVSVFRPYSTKREPDTFMLNQRAVRSYSYRLSRRVQRILEAGTFPLILGGDCTILLGNVLALQNIGNFGLVYLDSHADFYHAEASHTGEIADMTMQVVSGRCPELFPKTSRDNPLVQESCTAIFGYRNAEISRADGSADVLETEMCVYNLAAIREQGTKPAAQEILKFLDTNHAAGYWIHFDVDVLNDTIMPAVDYRIPDGLMFNEAHEALQVFLHAGNAVGMDITMYNPTLDLEKKIAHSLVDFISDAFHV